MKKNVKIFAIILTIIVFVLIGFYYWQEQEKIKIDEYNFEQLEKVKSILDPLDKDSYSIKDLKDFNKQFNQEIIPIKNCYYINDKNQHKLNVSGVSHNKQKIDGGYIFGFKLESNKYIKKYGTENYAYPKYDLPIHTICFGFGGGEQGCEDSNSKVFEYIISNSCEDE